MAFSSIVFLLYYLPVTLILYFAFSFSKTMQNIILIVLGLFFYAWGQPQYLILFIGTILFNYIIGILMTRNLRLHWVKKTFFIIGLAGNLSLLIWMKYTPLFSASLNTLTSGTIPVLEWLLPIGISFYIFSGISYLVDTWTQKTTVEVNFISLSLYFSFFPKLMQGPVVLYRDFVHQDYQRKTTLRGITNGVCRFIVGLSKKVLISNQMGIVTDRVFEINAMEESSILLAWLGILAYALQIYFDFSGYSDMAIGLAQIMGFELPENFNYPYISKSIGEFWRRWHITLGRFFREYVYFPLGGSRVGNQDIIIQNMAVVWILTGLWHGSNWNFLIWGIWNFIFIALERLFDFENTKIRASFKHIYAIFVILMGWVLFRSSSVSEAGAYYASMFNFFEYPIINDYFWLFIKEFFVFFIVGIFFSMPIAPMINKWFEEGIILRIFVSPNKVYPVHHLNEYPRLKWLFELAYPFVLMLLFAASYAYLINGSYTSFIYFQF